MAVNGIYGDQNIWLYKKQFNYENQNHCRNEQTLKLNDLIRKINAIWIMFLLASIEGTNGKWFMVNLHLNSQKHSGTDRHTSMWPVLLQTSGKSN